MAKSGVSNRAIEIGTAAEHIVCADLILRGNRAFLSAAGLSYDLVLDLGGRLVRVAVKSTTRAAKRPARELSRICYQFQSVKTKRNNRGITSARAYSTLDADLMAFVALDIRMIAYVPITDPFRTAWHIDPPNSPRLDRDRLGRRNSQNRKRFEDFHFDQAILKIVEGVK